jgi:exoribonuclease R
LLCKPIPHGEIRVEPNAEAEDEIDVILRIEGSHNAGYNQSSTDLSANDLESNEFEPPVSSSALLVTEMMILSGEAMGKFQKIAKPILDDEKLSILQLKNELDLPFRSQAKPNFSKRYQEINTLESLKDKGYCHAWYARRFFESVQVVNEFKPHYGLGLDCYVQWSSPIRRFGDLQVHAAVKRFLRRSKVNILMRKGESIPATLSDIHLGCDVPQQVEDSKDRNGKFTEYIVQNEANGTSSDLAISWKKGLGFIKAARIAQNKSKQYWLFEYVRRMIEKSSKDVVFDATVLALVDPNRYQYVIFIHELGLEHKYLSETGQLSTGSKLKVKVASVSPRHGLLTFTVSSKSHDRGNYAGAA